MRKIDISSPLGILTTIGMLAIVIKSQGDVSKFINMPSIMIVVLSTFFITFACFDFKVFASAPKYFLQLIINQMESKQQIISSMLKVSEFAFKNGLMMLEKNKQYFNNDRFFNKYLSMVIDGEKLNDIERIIDLEIIQIETRYRSIVSILKKASEVSPSMGLIGTIIGLVQMLSNLNDIKKIGPSMAIALMTTFYGAVLSYVILFPLAAKFEKNIENEITILRIYKTTIQSISKGEHYIRLASNLNSIVPTE